MKIKFYDKFLDLIAREACHPIGSRFSQIVGSRNSIGPFERTICNNQHLGMTRCEISLRYDHEGPSGAYGALSNPNFPERMHTLLNDIVAGVMNEPSVRALVHSTVSLQKMMRLFCRAESNAVVIGHNNCWVVNAVTSHRNHQVGTKRALKIRPGS